MPPRGHHNPVAQIGADRTALLEDLHIDRRRHRNPARNRRARSRWGVGTHRHDQRSCHAGFDDDGLLHRAEIAFEHDRVFARRELSDGDWGCPARNPIDGHARAVRLGPDLDLAVLGCRLRQLDVLGRLHAGGDRDRDCPRLAGPAEFDRVRASRERQRHWGHALGLAIDKRGGAIRVAGDDQCARLCFDLGRRLRKAGEGQVTATEQHHCHHRSDHELLRHGRPVGCSLERVRLTFLGDRAGRRGIVAKRDGRGRRFQRRLLRDRRGRRFGFRPDVRERRQSDRWDRLRP